MAAEVAAHESRYGKLDYALYQRLQQTADYEVTPVAIWVGASPGQTISDIQQEIYATLAKRYPEASEALESGRKPMDILDKDLAKRIELEYIDLLKESLHTRVQPLLTELQLRGLKVSELEGMPVIAGDLPKVVILEMSKHNDISAVYLTETKKQAELNSIAPTILAPSVWSNGYDGTGHTIAILDIGNIDTTNSYLHLSSTRRVAGANAFAHATETASVAASFHPTYKGIAYGATVMSVGETGTQSDDITALQWAFDNGAEILNASGGFEADAILHFTDKAFDYWTRSRNRLVVKSAGNTGGYITSPGKAWNLLTVGGFTDNNTSGWSDDHIWPSTSYTNPTSTYSDREKPEVVAVAAGVTVIGNNNQTIFDQAGTSYAAPQVSGLAGLLIHRDSSLNFWPEAIRAIIMASANHNIEGPLTIVRYQGDLRDGAGAVNARLAYEVAKTRGSYGSTCATSCWWGSIINNTNSPFPVGTDRIFSFNAVKGEIVHVAISWWSNADTPGNNYSFDRLDTDLDLGVVAPDGSIADSAISRSFDNNYEIVRLLATQSGVYNIKIHNTRTSESSNAIGIAVARTIEGTYLPIVKK